MNFDEFINENNIEKVIHVVFIVPIEVCFERNNKRQGREIVPEKVIRDMAKVYSMPEKGHMIKINEYGKEIACE